MTPRRARWRDIAGSFLAGCFMWLAGLGLGCAASLDMANMSPDDVKALQRRLTDAGCYKGAVDGVASGATGAAINACPDQRPFLRIETGIHTAVIRGIGVDAACRLLATASDDKTVRLWSLPDGKLQRIIRPPIGEGHGGKVYATALSPDGRRLAAGGWDASEEKTGTHSLTIFDLGNGAVRRFGAFETIVAGIAFSVDGRRIAVGLGAGEGVRVLDSVTGAELLADRDYGDDVLGLAFAPDGALITASFDGLLRRYGPDLKLAAKRPGPDGKQPFHVAIDPSGRRVAVGYFYEASVSILDATSFAPIAKGQTSAIDSFNLGRVAWSRDGGVLVAGGRAGAPFNGAWRSFVRRFDASGRRFGADVDLSDSTITDFQPCDKGFIFSAAAPSFGVLSPEGVATPLQGPRTGDMRDKFARGVRGFTRGHRSALRTRLWRQRPHRL